MVIDNSSRDSIRLGLTKSLQFPTPAANLQDWYYRSRFSLLQPCD